MKNKLRKALIAGAVAIGAVAGGLVTAAPAAADGYAVHFSHGVGGTTGFRVAGDGARVDAVRVTHGDGYPANYCGSQARTGGTLRSGSSWSTTFGYTAGCTPLVMSKDLSVNRYFKLGTNVWGDAAHDNAWAPGRPTIAIQ